jgi:hypothetical protein
MVTGEYFCLPEQRTSHVMPPSPTYKAVNHSHIVFNIQLNCGRSSICCRAVTKKYARYAAAMQEW